MPWAEVIPGVIHISAEDKLSPELEALREKVMELGKPVKRPDEETLARRMRRAGLPLATRQTHRFSQWQKDEKLTEAFEYARRFASGNMEHPFLTFAGQPGTGKTHLALAIAWEWLQWCSYPVAYWHVETFLDELRRGYASDRAEQGSETYLTLNYAKKCSLLVLDDLGAERVTDWSSAKLDEIVDFRYLNRLPTVFTLNIGSDELAPRLADRLFEGKIFVLDAESYRRRKKEGHDG